MYHEKKDRICLDEKMVFYGDVGKARPQQAQPASVKPSEREPEWAGQPIKPHSTSSKH
jgi:hypothetical protein